MELRLSLFKNFTKQPYQHKKACTRRAIFVQLEPLLMTQKREINENESEILNLC